MDENFSPKMFVLLGFLCIPAHAEQRSWENQVYMSPSVFGVTMNSANGFGIGGLYYGYSPTDVFEIGAQLDSISVSDGEKLNRAGILQMRASIDDPIDDSFKIGMAFGLGILDAKTHDSAGNPDTRTGVLATFRGPWISAKIDRLELGTGLEFTHSSISGHYTTQWGMGLLDIRYRFGERTKSVDYHPSLEKP